MSIVLQGSTSGSITLQEPAIAGSNTINLPAATGTAVLTGVSGTVDINAAGSNNVTLSTNSTERMRVTSAGRVGIGTSSPASLLHVASSDAQITCSNADASVYTYMLRDGFYSVGGRMDIYTGGANAQTFWTNANERMRIDSSGYVSINRNSAYGNSYLNIQYSSTSQYGIIIGNTSTTFNGAFIEFRNSAGNSCGSIVQNGTTTVSYSTSSDYRLKENITPMTGALEKVAQLKPVTYNWKVDGSAGQGFIAHELQEVCPDAVTGQKDGVETYIDEEGNEQTRPKYQGVDTSFLVATLTAAIQELKGIVDTQATKIAELEAKLEGTA